VHYPLVSQYKTELQPRERQRPTASEEAVDARATEVTPKILMSPKSNSTSQEPKVIQNPRIGPPSIQKAIMHIPVMERSAPAHPIASLRSISQRQEARDGSESLLPLLSAIAIEDRKAPPQHIGMPYGTPAIAHLERQDIV